MLSAIIFAIATFLTIATTRGPVLHAVDSLWLKVSAQVIPENGSVQLTCHVPRHADNRFVELGIEGYRASQIPLEGENSAATHQILFKRIPCGIGSAYCTVTNSTGQGFGPPKVTILVSGCE